MNKVYQLSTSETRPDARQKNIAQGEPVKQNTQGTSSYTVCDTAYPSKLRLINSEMRTVGAFQALIVENAIGSGWG